MTRDRLIRAGRWWFAAGLVVVAARLVLVLFAVDPSWVLPGLDPGCLMASTWYFGRARGQRDTQDKTR